jgi:hypothetical protein
MPEALAEFEGGGEALAGKLVLAEPEVGDAAEVETVGFSPGVLAVGRFRAVERIAGVLEGFAGVARGEECFGESDAEVGSFSVAFWNSSPVPESADRPLHARARPERFLRWR